MSLDQEDFKEKIKRAYTAFEEINVISESLVKSSSKLDTMSMGAYVSTHNQLNEVIGLLKLYNETYSDEPMKKLENALVFQNEHMSDWMAILLSCRLKGADKT